MSFAETQLSFFDDCSPEGLMRQDLITVISDVKKINRSLHAKASRQDKQINDLKAEMALIKSHLRMDLHRNEPLFLFSKS